jgi:hypothetical protein
MKQKVIIAIIALLVIAGGIYVYTQQDDNSVESNNNQTNDLPQEGDIVGDVPQDPEEDPLTPTSDTIAVSTQIAGDSVTIDNAYFSKPGFISIHEVTSKGMAGNVIGTSGYLTVGPKQDLEITATLTPGAKYIAMLRADNGDKKFNAQQDEAITSNDAPIMTMFSVSQ